MKKSMYHATRVIINQIWAVAAIFIQTFFAVFLSLSCSFRKFDGYSVSVF